MNRKYKLSLASVTVASSMALVLSGCGVNNVTGARAADKAVDGGSITIAQGTAFDPQFIPNLSSNGYTGGIDSFAFDTLLSTDKNMHFIPWLAKSWTWSQDKKSVTIELQPNANWSDGKPITSDDVLFTLDFLASKDYNTTLQGQSEYMVDPILGSDAILNGKKTSFAQTGGFKKLSDKKFTLTFKQVDAAVLYSDIATLQPIPSHILKKIPIKDWTTATYNRVPTAVSGPYQFVRVNGTDSVEMTANTHYWKVRPHITNITWKTANSDIQPGLLAKGDITLSINGLKGSYVDQLKQMPKINVVTKPGMNYSYIGMKMYQPEFKDIRVRQAFMYATDREGIVKGIMKGYATVINGPVPAVNWAAATPKDGLLTYDYNVKKANQLLDKAGWKKGKDGWRIDPATGKPANLSLITSTSSTNTQMAIAFQQNLEKVGVKVTVTPLDFDAELRDIQANSKSVDFFTLNWSLSPDPDPRGIWGATNPSNTANFVDAADDALIAKTYNAAAFSQATRKKALVNWQIDINHKLPYIFLFQKHIILAYQNNLHIPANDISALSISNPQDWWVTK